MRNHQVWSSGKRERREKKRVERRRREKKRVERRRREKKIRERRRREKRRGGAEKGAALEQRRVRRSKNGK